MEEFFQQLISIFIYAPLPIAIIWLLIGAAFSKATRGPQPPSAAPEEDR